MEIITLGRTPISHAWTNRKRSDFVIHTYTISSFESSIKQSHVDYYIKSHPMVEKKNRIESFQGQICTTFFFFFWVCGGLQGLELVDTLMYGQSLDFLPVRELISHSLWLDSHIRHSYFSVEYFFSQILCLTTIDSILWFGLALIVLMQLGGCFWSSIWKALLKRVVIM